MRRAQARGLTRIGLVGLASHALVLSACGDLVAPSPPRRPRSFGPAFEHALCEARCARSIRCQGPREATCGCASIDDSGLLRADWANAEIACLGRTACEAEEDCEANAYRAIGVAPLSWPPVAMRCFQRGDVCGGSSLSCRRLAAMSDDARAEFATCLDEPCPEFAACFRSFFAARVAPAVPSWR